MSPPCIAHWYSISHPLWMIATANSNHPGRLLAIVHPSRKDERVHLGAPNLVSKTSLCGFSSIVHIHSRVLSQSSPTFEIIRYADRDFPSLSSYDLHARRSALGQYSNILTFPWYRISHLTSRFRAYPCIEIRWITNKQVLGTRPFFSLAFSLLYISYTTHLFFAWLTCLWDVYFGLLHAMNEE